MMFHDISRHRATRDAACAVEKVWYSVLHEASRRLGLRPFSCVLKRVIESTIGVYLCICFQHLCKARACGICLKPYGIEKCDTIESDISFVKSPQSCC